MGSPAQNFNAIIGKLNCIFNLSFNIMRPTTDMNIQPIDGSTFMTILTIGFYWGAVILGTVTLQGIAAVAAILAGVSTFAFNAYRFYKEYKEARNKQT
jgi:multisubunit Na+/H+ antiporter MnhF subunit